MDDGYRRKWILVVPARELPAGLPLDANARVPHVLKNRTCAEMRTTLLSAPELFQTFNGGIICTAESLEVRQIGNTQQVILTFDRGRGQGIVNGGHTYATLLQITQGSTEHSDGRDLPTVLTSDLEKGEHALTEVVQDFDRLHERINFAKDRAMVQIEIVVPVDNSELLAGIARARNLSQSVEATALMNLEGRFDMMKQALADSFGADF